MAKAETDRKLQEKITNLRESFGLSKEKFSEKLQVHRSQLSRWEIGTEPPSNEKLIMLGNLADEVLKWPIVLDADPPSMERMKAVRKLRKYPDSHWFWERAGINVDAVRESVLRTLSQQNPSADGKIVDVPRLDTAGLLQLVSSRRPVDAKHFATDFMPFPALFVSEPASTICVQGTGRLAGSRVFAGNLSLVRLGGKKRDTTDDLPDRSFENLIGCSVAAFYESLPMTRELSPEMMRRGRPPARLFTDRDRRILELNEALLRERDPVAAAEQDKKDEKLWDKAVADATAPGVLFGTLRVQSDENWDGDFNHFKGDHPWRLVLDCGATWNGLTSWSTEAFPWDGTLRHRLIPELHVHILGSVIGWLRAPGTDGAV